jgi:penicillin-binding protein
MADTNGSRRRVPGWIKPIFKIVIALIIIGGFGVFGVVSGFVAATLKDEPVRSGEEIKKAILENNQTGFAYFSNNELIGNLRAQEDRRIIDYNDIPDLLIKAVVATEDQQFFHHHGVNFKSIGRAVLQQVTNSDVQTGGSTITQQLVKYTFLTLDKTYTRKAKEIFLALRTERFLTKQQIITAYLNKIPFGKNANGSNIFGIEAAAKGIFGVNDLHDLNLAQIAYLAGLVQRPFGYSPFDPDGLKAGLERQKTVLGRMLEEGYITQEQMDEAINFNLQASLAKPTKAAYQTYPFLMYEIEERAAKALLEVQGVELDKLTPSAQEQAMSDARQQLLNGGYRVYTTIDKTVYDAMQQVAANPKNFMPNISYTAANGTKIKDALEELGVTLIENQTGKILGMIGGRDFNKQQVNHTTRPRQPGSAMKPIAAYAPAIQEGLLQPASAIDDTPLGLKNGSSSKLFYPVNWDNKYHGLMTARTALNQSYNIPAIKTYLNVGIPKALDYVKKMGITTLVKADNYAQTGVIGGLTYGVTVEELTNAYATFANQGTFVDAYLIEQIKDAEGNVIYQHKPETRTIFSDRTSFLITDMMRTVVTNGTGRSLYNQLAVKRDLAGKTGTTNDSNDLWFVGYTPKISMGIWMGYDIPHPLANGRRANDLWAKIFNAITKAEPDLSPSGDKFPQPDGVVRMTVSSKSGLLPSDIVKEAGYVVTDWFDVNQVPTKIDDVVTKGQVVQYNGKNYLAKDSTPEDMRLDGIFIKREPYTIPDGANPLKYRPLDWEQILPTETDPRENSDGRPPSPPGNVTLNGATITWSPAPEDDIVGYRIYRAASTDATYQKVGSVLLGQDATWTDPDASGGPYAYYVSSVDVAGLESKPSTTVLSTGGTAPPPETDNPVFINAPQAPVGLSIQSVPTGAMLSWEARPDDEQVNFYNIYSAQTADGNYQLLGNTKGTSYTYVNTENKEIWFKVTAVNASGESKKSKAVRFNPGGNQNPPTGSSGNGGNGENNGAGSPQQGANGGIPDPSQHIPRPTD